MDPVLPQVCINYIFGNFKFEHFKTLSINYCCLHITYIFYNT